MIQFLWFKFIQKMHLKAIRDSSIHKTSKVEAGSMIYNVDMSKHSFCGYGTEIINCEIGAFCSIANGVVIGGGEHPINWVSTSPVFYSGRDSVKAKFSEYERNPAKRTIIGNDVWIGRNAILKQGVSIGHGAIVGMGSIVTRDVQPYSIVGGNPAKLIRYRFDQTMIEELLNSKWWDLDDSYLMKLAHLIKEPNEFIEELKKCV